jgi:hypothetical protein
MEGTPSSSMVVLSKWRISAALTTGVPQGIIFRFSLYPEISCFRKGEIGD